MKSRFSIDFSMVRSPNRVLTPFKSASFEIRISSFVILKRWCDLPKSSFGEHEAEKSQRCGHKGVVADELRTHLQSGVLGQYTR
jgi:hypothetical protein